MSTVLDALGRSAVVEDLIQSLADHQQCWISGLSGTGKTEMSRRVAARHLCLSGAGQARYPTLLMVCETLDQVFDNSRSPQRVENCTHNWQLSIAPNQYTVMIETR